MSVPPLPTTVRVVAPTGLPGDALARHPSFREPDLWLELHTPARNVSCDLRALAEQLGAPGGRTDLWLTLSSLAELATIVYAADLGVPRGVPGELGAMPGDAWTRHFEFLVPVSEADVWRQSEPVLARLLTLLTGDDYVFAFCDHTGEGRAPAAQGPMPRESDCVALLSGGLDSFAGAVVLLRGGRRPLLVSHRPGSPTVAAAQEHVVAQLRAAFGAEAVGTAHLSPGPAHVADPRHDFPGPELREPSQRARSFLYLSLAAIAATAAGCTDLYMPENGVIAINVPLSAARIGGYSTLSTHPLVLRSFEDLARELGLHVHPQNPLVGQTKGQLVRDILKPQFSAAAIQGTVSCWMAGRTERPCGGCIPCLVRAVAMHAAGLPAEAHQYDPLSLKATRPRSAARANLVDLLSFADDVLRLSDQETVRAHPALLDVLPAGLSVRDMLSLLRRFAGEVVHAAGLPPPAPQAAPA